MPRSLIFLGSSEQIIEIKETCDLIGIDVAGIIDSDYYGNTDNFDGIPYIGSEHTADWAALKTEYDFFIAVAAVPHVPRNIEKRKNLIKLVNDLDLPCANVIDPQCRISPRAQLGKGIFVAYGAYISPNTQIGDHCQIHCNGAVMHDSVLGQNTILQRAASIISNVRVGENVYIAPFARLLKTHSTVGDDSVIKLGVMVFRDIEPGEVVGITGRKIYSMITDTPET